MSRCVEIPEYNSSFFSLLQYRISPQCRSIGNDFSPCDNGVIASILFLYLYIKSSLARFRNAFLRRIQPFHRFRYLRRPRSLPNSDISGTECNVRHWSHSRLGEIYGCSRDAIGVRSWRKQPRPRVVKDGRLSAWQIMQQLL